MKIRLVKENDCKICAELSKIKELELNNSYVPEDYFKLLVDKDKMFFVAEEKGDIIGFILGEPMKGNIAFLSLLAVKENSRGKGVGKKLIKVFEKRCREKGLNLIIFYAPKFNKKTIKFYKKQGFIPGKEHIQFMKTLK